MEKKNEEAKRVYNNQHLNGFVEAIRKEQTKEGKPVYNITVCTKENFPGKEQPLNSYHNVVVFPQDKAVKGEKLSESLDGMMKALEAGETKRIALDGRLIYDKGMDTNKVVAKNSTIVFDPKGMKEGEAHNRLDFVGRVASIDKKNDGFVTLSVIGHDPVYGKDRKVDHYTDTPVRVAVNDKGQSAGLYKAIEEGKVKVGDQIALNGQLHNNNFEKGEAKKFQYQLAPRGFEVLKVAAEKKEVKAEVKAEKKPAAKKTEPKKAVSRKKAPKIA